MITVNKLSTAPHEEAQDLNTLTGGYNDFPAGWKEITAAEFAKKHYVSGDISYIEVRQMVDRTSGKPFFSSKMTQGTLFHNDTGGGFAIVCDSHKGTSKFFSFDCADKLQKTFEALPVVSDSTWAGRSGSSIPHRGITDFSRTIEFERELTPWELKMVKMWVDRDKPGWTPMHCSKMIDDRSYRFSTTMDSSD